VTVLPIVEVKLISATGAVEFEGRPEKEGRVNNHWGHVLFFEPLKSPPRGEGQIFLKRKMRREEGACAGIVVEIVKFMKKS